MRIIGISALIFAVVIVITALILCAYFLIYKRRINKALSEDTPSPKRMPSPGSIAFVLLSIVVVIYLGSVSARLDRLQEELLNIQTQNEAKISMLESEIDEKLKKQASMISSYRLEYGKLNVENNTAEIFIWLTPKAVTENAEIWVKLGKHTVMLKKEASGEFCGVFNADIFETYADYSILNIKEEGVTKTEQLEDFYPEVLWTHYLPVLLGDLVEKEVSCTSSGRIDKVNGTILIYEKMYDSDIEFKNNSYCLVTEINGEVTENENISSLIKTNSVDGSKEIRFSKSLNISKDDSLIMYLTATDELGYLHRVVLCGYSDGCESAFVNANDDIYDENGKILFQGF